MNEQASFEHLSLSDKVYRRIKNDITNAVLKPGQKIKDGYLSQDFGISRTPIREALKKMEKDGLVHFIPRKGYFVTRFTEKDIRDIYFLRKILETATIRIATPLCHQEELKNIKKKIMIAQKKLAKKKDLKYSLVMDVQFHGLIRKSCDNSRLKEILEIIHNQMQGFFTLQVERNPDRIRKVNQEHLLIIEGMLKRDVPLAEKLMREHIENVEQSVLRDFFPKKEKGKLAMQQSQTE